MKPHFYKVPTPSQSSFSVRHDVEADFGCRWHYHPELELHLTIKGEGFKFIGDNVSNFSAGDIVFLGENLPHTWRCKDEFYHHEAPGNVEAIVIQFLPDCLGKDFMNLPEAYSIPRLFEKARRGMEFTGNARARLKELMIESVSANAIDKLIILLSMLKLMAETDEYTPIASAHAFYKSNESESIRLNKVYNYTIANYKNDITLTEIASFCNLSVTSFCRYFKMMSKKTYYDFLVEIRISHACRLLVEDKQPIGMVCFECGFNNVSNFYRHFRKITGRTPLDYKRRYLKSIQP